MVLRIRGEREVPAALWWTARTTVFIEKCREETTGAKGFSFIFCWFCCCCCCWVVFFLYFHFEKDLSLRSAYRVSVVVSSKRGENLDCLRRKMKVRVSFDSFFFTFIVCSSPPPPPSPRFSSLIKISCSLFVFVTVFASSLSDSLPLPPPPLALSPPPPPPPPNPHILRFPSLFSPPTDTYLVLYFQHGPGNHISLLNQSATTRTSASPNPRAACRTCPSSSQQLTHI